MSHGGAQGRSRFVSTLETLLSIHDAEVDSLKAEINRLQGSNESSEVRVAEEGGLAPMGLAPMGPQWRPVARAVLSPRTDTKEQVSPQAFQTEPPREVTCGASLEDEPILGLTVRATSPHPPGSRFAEINGSIDEEQHGAVGACADENLLSGGADQGLAVVPGESDLVSQGGTATPALHKLESTISMDPWLTPAQKRSSGTRSSSNNGKPKGAFLTSVIEGAHAEKFEDDKQGVKQQGSLPSIPTFYASFMGFVVFVNPIVIGLQSDIIWDGWVVIDAIFAFLFMTEAIFKLVGIGCRKYFCGPGWVWNLFEAALALLAVMETGLGFTAKSGAGDTDQQQSGASKLMSLARIVRLFRITRIFRLARLKMFSDLVVMLRGTVGGVRTLLWSAVLIALPLYVFALFFRETLGSNAVFGQGAENFSTVPGAFFTMFRCVVAADCNDVEGYPIFIMVTRRYGWGFAVLYCMVVMFMTFGLFNVIVAIFVENVIEAAKSSDQIMRKQRLRDQVYLADKMVELLMAVWDSYQRERRRSDHIPITAKMTLEELVELSAPMEIERTLWNKLRQNEKVKAIFHDLDVAEEDQFKMFDTLDVDGSGTIDVEELCEGIAKLRGDARRGDIVGISLQLRTLHESVQDLIRQNVRASEISRPSVVP